MQDTELLYPGSKGGEDDHEEYHFRSTRLRRNNAPRLRTRLHHQVKECGKSVCDCVNCNLIIFLLIVVLFLAIIIFGMSGAQQTVTVNPRAVQETVKGNIDFTFSLYKILAKAKSGNIIVSPMSLEVVLAMAYFGARGETAEQIATGISLPAERNLALDGFRHLLSSFKSTSNITLEIANKVFTQQNYVIKEDFQALAKNSFLSEAQALNFADNVVSAGVINQWVEERTKNKIKDLISPDMLDSLTRLVMVNAVYFKGNWQDQFKPEMTTTEPFYVSAEVKKDVRMMHLKKHFRYSEVDELEAQVLELPYEERQVSMVILLPNDRNGLPNLEAKLTSEKLTEVLSQLHSTEVNVSIPRFKLEDTIDLNSVLQEMGMNNMFEESADFSGITDDAAGLKVSQVVQKAFIEVNEEGSEAAAATALRMVTKKFVRVKSFKANHPFIFVLQHQETRAVLFLGRVALFE